MSCAVRRSCGALSTAVSLTGDDPGLHLLLAEMYEQQQCLDSAWTTTPRRRLFEARCPTDRRQHEEFQAQLQVLDDRFKAMEADVNRRLSDYELKAANLKPMDRVRLAYDAAYRRIDQTNRESVDQRGRGLTKQALKVLAEVDPATLSPEELAEWRVKQLQISLKLGHLPPSPRCCRTSRDTFTRAITFRSRCASMEPPGATTICGRRSRSGNSSSAVGHRTPVARHHVRPDQ